MPLPFPENYALAFLGGIASERFVARIKLQMLFESLGQAAVTLLAGEFDGIVNLSEPEPLALT